MNDPVVDLRAITKTFDDGRVVALSGVDLTVSEGEFVAVTGRSGSGKTTLLNILGLLDSPTSGTFRLNGVSTGDLPERTRSEVRARQVGFIFQDSFLIPGRTSLENVELGLRLAGIRRGPQRTKRSREVLSAVGLAHRLESRSRTLSGGERQRVALARALANRPSLVLCDEPTGNLDVETGEQVMDLIWALPTNGSCVILVTHDLELARRADRVVILQDGARIDAADG
jgi:ABC-type lipoprotein export system ATPase subunit